MKCALTLILMVFLENSFCTHLDRETLKYITTGTDITKSCNREGKLVKFLTTGMGLSDSAKVIITNSPDEISCTIIFMSEELTFGVSQNTHMIIVVEFLNTQGAVCTHTKMILYEVKNSAHSIDVCKFLLDSNKSTSNPMTYRIILATQAVGVNLTNVGESETITITATVSRRLVRSDQQCDDKEILCLVDGKSLCISEKLKCDRNIYCGIKCNESEMRVNNFWVVLLSSSMIILLLFFVLNLFSFCIPKVAKNFFVFSEDEDNKLIVASMYSPRKDEQIGDEIYSIAPRDDDADSIMAKLFISNADEEDTRSAGDTNRKQSAVPEHQNVHNVVSQWKENVMAFEKKNAAMSGEDDEDAEVDEEEEEDTDADDGEKYVTETDYMVLI